MAAVTRLGLYGGSRGLYGDFSTKEPGTPVVDDAVRRGGGWKFLMQFEDFSRKKDEDEEKRKEIAEAIENIDSPVDQEIAQLLQQDQIRDAREKELQALEDLIQANATAQDFAAAKAHNKRIAKAFVRAAVQKNFSAIEGLEREMARKMEEDEFLMLALVILS